MPRAFLQTVRVSHGLHEGKFADLECLDQAFCVFEFEVLEPRLERTTYFDIVGF